MVPISFVSDRVETLCGINLLYKEQGKALGMRLARTASLKTHPFFIQGLTALVKDACRQQDWL